MNMKKDQRNAQMLTVRCIPIVHQWIEAQLLPQLSQDCLWRLHQTQGYRSAGKCRKFR